MKLYTIHNQLLEDSGAAGREFEQYFIDGLKLVGLKFNTNSTNGVLWDIQPIGSNWVRMITDKFVNIKIARTKWLFGSTIFTSILPWDDIGEDWSQDQYIKKIKRIINKYKIQDIIFLKPKNENIQNKIIDAVIRQDVPALNLLFTKNNFSAEKLGNNYDVRILTKNNYITSIVLLKSGKVFARAERPRQVGGSNFVGFKTDNPRLSKIDRKIKDYK